MSLHDPVASSPGSAFQPLQLVHPGLRSDFRFGHLLRGEVPVPRFLPAHVPGL